MEERAWPTVLCENLAKPVFARDVVVLCPIEASPDLDGSDYELRAVERGLQGGDRADLAIATELFGERFGVAADVRQVVGDDVHETQVDVVFCERLAEQDVAHGFGAKGAAAGANQGNDDRLHAQSPIGSRPIPVHLSKGFSGQQRSQQGVLRTAAGLSCTCGKSIAAAADRTVSNA